VLNIKNSKCYPLLEDWLIKHRHQRSGKVHFNMQCVLMPCTVRPEYNLQINSNKCADCRQLWPPAMLLGRESKKPPAR
jgi:hypothetical protein